VEVVDNETNAVVLNRFVDEMDYDYAYAPSLLFDKVSSDEFQRFATLSNLQDIIQIRQIEEQSHPCFGQLGLFAVRFIPKLSYIGEYTGRVTLLTPEVYKSKYLVDYSNPYEQGLEQVWVDAGDAGNETRYINDCSGTGHTANIHFRRAWIGGRMQVVVQALVDIQPNQELLVEYGEGYWGNLPKEDLPENVVLASFGSVNTNDNSGTVEAVVPGSAHTD